MQPVRSTDDVPGMEMVWQRLSQHLSDLADTTRSLEAASSQCQIKDLSPELVLCLQSFDYLEQALDDLALFAKGMGASDAVTNPENLAAISAGLKLAATKSLIVTDPGSVRPAPHGKSTDDPMIF